MLAVKGFVFHRGGCRHVYIAAKKDEVDNSLDIRLRRQVYICRFEKEESAFLLNCIFTCIFKKEIAKREERRI